MSDMGLPENEPVLLEFVPGQEVEILSQKTWTHGVDHSLLNFHESRIGLALQRSWVPSGVGSGEVARIHAIGAPEVEADNLALLGHTIGRHSMRHIGTFA